MCTKFWLQKPEGRYHSEDVDIDRIILNWMFWKSGLGCGLD
jgi:hypothetical protein